jgi:hypothetical protein
MERGAMAQCIPQGSIYMINLLDEKSPDKIAKSTGARIWKVIIIFGSARAGILAVFIIARLANLIIDTIIPGYALHSFYESEIRLLTAIWSSVINLLFHPAWPIITNQANQSEDPQPAKTFQRQKSLDIYPFLHLKMNIPPTKCTTLSA